MAYTTTGLLIVLLHPLDMMADTHKFSAGGISSMSGLFWWLRLYNYNCSLQVIRTRGAKMPLWLTFVGFKV